MHVDNETTEKSLNARRLNLGRRAFLRLATLNCVGGSLLTTSPSGGSISKLVAPKIQDCESEFGFILPGKLGNPELTLLEDPRLHPAIRNELMNNSDPKPGIFPPNVTMDSPYHECVELIEYMHNVLMDNDRDVSAIREQSPRILASKETIRGEDGTEIPIFIERPKVVDGLIPCVVHIHGGGMTFSSADSFETVSWRTKIAQQGVFVVGVEFRSEALNVGHHPFPNGLNDCAAAVRWVFENKSKLGISSLILAGESGGGNLAIGLGIKANKEGWVDEIDGVYAMAPMINGVYDQSMPALSSWHENMGYQGTLPFVRAMTKVYDPESRYKNDPRTWPFCAKKSDLVGLPPHIIVNYELDLIRDDGVIFAQRLQSAGVSASSRIVNGAHHVPEIAMPDAIPDVTTDTIMSLSAFAKGTRVFVSKSQ